MTSLGISGYLFESLCNGSNELYDSDFQALESAIDSGDDIDLELMESYVDNAVANEQNFNMIMMSVANEEVQYFMENGTEMIYEEGKISAFFSKIIDMIKSAWEKIKGLFASVINAIKGGGGSSSKGNDKSTASSACTALAVRISKSPEAKQAGVSGPPERVEKTAIQRFANKVFLEDELSPVINGHPGDCYARIKKKTEDYIEQFDTWAGGKMTDTKEGNLPAIDYTGYLRGAAVGSNSILSEDEFTKALNKEYGMDEPVTAVRYPANVIISELYGGSSTEKEINNAYKQANALFVRLQKTAETLKKSAEKDFSGRLVDKNSIDGRYMDNFGAGATKIPSMIMQLTSGAIAVSNRCQRAQIQALSKFRSNCRALEMKCLAMLQKNISGTAAAESADIDMDDNAILLL